MADVTPPFLEVKNMSVSFPLEGNGKGRGRITYVKAVDGVSFRLWRGRTLGIVGESGCGKTTLGRCIASFQPPGSGTVTLDGKELSSLRGKALRKNRRRIQMIFQNPFASLDPRMTVFSTIAEAFQERDSGGRRRLIEKVAGILEQVGLDPAMMRKFPHEFSGGQRQRIAIARALAAEPDCIIADEPVSSLDVSVAAQILNLLHELRKKLHLTMLFISHDLSVVRYISHMILVMYKGKIVESGEAEELFAHPCHPYTAMLLRAVPVIPDSFDTPAFFESVPQQPNSAITGSGCGFADRCLYAQKRCTLSVPLLRGVDGGEDGSRHECACHRLGEPGMAI